VVDEGEEAPHIEWIEGVCDLNAADLLLSARKRRKPDALDQAVEFLLNELADGPKLSKEVEGRAETLKISKSTLKRAREKVNISVTNRTAFQRMRHGPWYIALEPIAPHEQFENGQWEDEVDDNEE
jgi:hypothetical protein